MLMGIPGDRLSLPITGPIVHGPIDGGAGGLTVSLHPMHNRATRSVTIRWIIRPFLCWDISQRVAKRHRLRSLRRGNTGTGKKYLQPDGPQNIKKYKKTNKNRTF